MKRLPLAVALLASVCAAASAASSGAAPAAERFVFDSRASFPVPPSLRARPYEPPLEPEAEAALLLPEDPKDASPGLPLGARIEVELTELTASQRADPSFKKTFEERLRRRSAGGKEKCGSAGGARYPALFCRTAGADSLIRVYLLTPRRVVTISAATLDRETTSVIKGYRDGPP